MKNNLNWYSFLLVTLFIAGATSARTFIVDAGGPTPQAVQVNAAKKALGRAVALYLPSSAQSELNQKLNEWMFPKSAAYVKAQRVISEQKVLGFYNQKVAVDINTAMVRDSLAVRNLIDARAVKPVIAIDINVDNGDSTQNTGAAASFAKALLDEGFRISPLKHVNNVESDSAVAIAAFTAGADLIVRAQIKIGEPKNEDLYGETLPFVPIGLNGRILSTGTGEQVAARTHSVYRGNLSVLSATEFGIRTGGTELCSLLIADLEQYWRSEGYNHRRLRLEFLKCGYDSIDTLQKRIAAIPVLRAIRLVQTDMHGILFEADCAGNPHDIANRVIQNGDWKVAALKTHLLSFIPSNFTDTLQKNLQFTSEIDFTFSVDTLFPSRAGAYLNDSIAHLRLEQKSLLQPMRIEAHLPDFMQLPATFDFSESGFDTLLNLPMALDAPKLLAQQQASTVYAECKIKMGNGGTHALTVPVRVQGRNDFDWSCPDAIGGFITLDDPVLLKIASEIQRSVDNNRIDYPVRTAAAIFGYLRSAGISYVRDPQTEGFSAFDRIQYPRETLARSAGDCDDIAVLYAAVCMSMEVPAALLVYADHVLVMINTGVSPRNVFALSADTSLTIEHNGSLWLPVETTALKSGFTKAWKQAATDYHSAITEQRDVTIISLGSAMQRFRPVTSPALPNATIKESIDYRESILQELAELEIDRKNLSAAHYSQLKRQKPNNATVITERALLEVYAGNYQKAIKLFKKVYHQSNSFKAANNYACAAALAGDYANAKTVFEKICSEKQPAPVLLNSALILLPVLNDSSVRSVFYNRIDAAARAFTNPDSVMELLNITATTGKAAEQQTNSQAVINRQRLRELVMKRVDMQKKDTVSSSQQKPILPVSLPGGVRGADPQDVEKLVTLFYWYTTP